MDLWFAAALVEAATVALVGLDLQDRVVAWNHVAEELLHVPAAQACGRPITALEIASRVPDLPARLAAVKETRAALPAVDVALAPGNGAGSIVAVTLAPALDAERRLTGVVLCIEDRGALHALREELRRSGAELEAARLEAERKNQFLAVLAHELRTPLAPILSAVSVLRRQERDETRVRQALEVVERQVRHQARLLDDLLDVSRIIRDKVELRKLTMDLATVVADAVEASRPLIEARRHTLSVSLPDKPIRLAVDPTRLGQVVVNLLTNAAKYTPPGGRIGLVLEREPEGAALRVRDTGAGIPPAVRPRIFDLFVQGEPRPAGSVAGGLGIGLALVKRLVEAHGGTVEARSEGAGRGAEFIVRLPLAGKPDTPHPFPEPVASAPARAVLIIEDDDDTREMLRTVLELDGHRVEAAADGARGLDLASVQHPDIVFVDLGLPGMDGYEVVKRLRADLGPAVRLLALSGHARPEDRSRALAAGCDAYFVKPVGHDELRRALVAGAPRVA